MGDALSGACLRLFKFARERACASDESRCCVCIPGSRSQLAHIKGVNVRCLDVSFRDDLRIFAVWDSARGLAEKDVEEWAWRRLEKRYHVGTMILETSETESFVGLKTSWRRGRLIIAPLFPEPFAAALYNDLDNAPLKPWRSWAPVAQKCAVIRAMLCRVWRFSNDDFARQEALAEALVLVVSRAGFPLTDVKRTTRAGARSWAPLVKSMISRPNLDDIDLALERTR